MASATAARLALGASLVGGDPDGTFFSINATSGFVGDFFNIQQNGTSRLRMGGNGRLYGGSDAGLGWGQWNVAHTVTSVSPVSPEVGHQVYFTANPTANIAQAVMGQDVKVIFSGTQSSTRDLIGCQFGARFESTGSMRNLEAFASFTYNASGSAINFLTAQSCFNESDTGIVQEGHGLWYQIGVYGGTVISNYGVKLVSPDVSGGAITTDYGIWIGDRTAAGTNYAIYTGAGFVRLGGQVLLPTAPPASATAASLLLGSALVSGDVDGTYVGINAASGYLGDFLRFQVDGVSRFRVNGYGNIGINRDPSSTIHLAIQPLTGVGVTNAISISDEDGNERFALFSNGSTFWGAVPSTALVTAQNGALFSLQSSRWDGAASQVEQHHFQVVRYDSGVGRNALWFNNNDGVASLAIAGKGGQVAVGYGFPAAATLASLGQFHVRSVVATTPTATFMGAASQSANLTEWQNSAAAVKASVNAIGNLLVGGGESQPKIVFGAADASHVGLVRVGTTLQCYLGDFSAHAEFQAGTITANGQLRSYGPAGQIGITNRADNQPAWAFYSAAGGLAIYDVIGGGDRVQMDVGTAGVRLAVLGAASQSGNLQEWRNSSAAVLSEVSENGYFITRKVTAPADGEVATSAAAFWFNDTAGAATAFLELKGKDAGGTVRTGKVALFQSAAYTLSNVTADRSFDANATTLDEIADCLGTLVQDLQAQRILG